MANTRNFVVRNWPLKLMAVAISVLLWLSVAREPQAEVVHTVPIEFQNVPPDVAISTASAPQVEIWLRGPLRAVRGVQATELHPVIDLSLAPRTLAERTYTLSTSNIRAPRGIEIVQVIPSEFHLRFDRRTSRAVEVHPRVVGTSAPGFHIAEVACEPKTVTVIGPKERVDKIEDVLTDAVDATGLRGRQTFTTTAYVDDPMVRVEGEVEIRVTIVAEQNPEPDRGGEPAAGESPGSASEKGSKGTRSRS